MHHRGWIKGRLAVIIASVTAEIPQIRIPLDLQNNFFIEIAYSPWMRQTSKANWRGMATLPVPERNKSAYFASILFRGMVCTFFTQCVSSRGIIPTGCWKSDKLICPLLYQYIPIPPSARFLHTFIRFLCTYYNIDGCQCLTVQREWDCSIELIIFYKFSELWFSHIQKNLLSAIISFRLGLMKCESDLLFQSQQ